MNEQEIDILFQEQIQIKGIEKKAGITTQVIYNYRNRPRLSVGEKIVFLMKIGAIKVVKNES
ncbi:hypothetical protein ACI6PS_02605 [Flavobacterium sp. PLA-1-15]|uniref:hypothetical protein n=1 Tax=Flavobacterium sp. PLA-1-15 TaxID=3380533 RepID=UPI003B816F71